MLEIRELIKIYPGPVAALRGIDLTIPRGLFGLLGPNGSGKSTLMRILAGLLAPTSGAVLFDGIDVVREPERLWPRLGYLPQDFGFYPHLSGEAMLRHLLELKGISAPGGLAALCGELLAKVNLSAAAGRKVKTYSGGMRQRLGIAQAIAGRPELLIVDEPTAGLDPEERMRFYRLLAELAEERTLLLSTHIVEDVAMLCPRFAVVRYGQLMAVTTPGEAKAAMAGKIFEGMVSHRQLEELGRGGRLTQARLVEGRNLVRLYAPEGDVPAGFELVPPTLEDAYLVLSKPVPAGSTGFGEAA